MCSLPPYLQALVTCGAHAGGVVDASKFTTGQVLPGCSDRKLVDGTTLWTMTKSGIRYHAAVANATYRPDLAEGV